VNPEIFALRQRVLARKDIAEAALRHAQLYGYIATTSLVTALEEAGAPVEVKMFSANRNPAAVFAECCADLASLDAAFHYYKGVIQSVDSGVTANIAARYPVQEVY
jgi:hypothetical protein